MPRTAPAPYAASCDCSRPAVRTASTSKPGSDLLAWDTRNPDPARWPVIRVDIFGSETFPGTLTELYVAELTGTGLGLASFEPGNPANWAWPVWGPDTPLMSQPRP